jgi:uncharacterized protein
MASTRKRTLLLVLLALVLSSCQPAPVRREGRESSFHAELEQALQRNGLAACTVTQAIEKVEVGGHIEKINHVKVVAPNPFLVQQAAQVVESLASRNGFSFKRLASSRDGAASVLYEVTEGGRRISSVLLMPESGGRPERSTALPSEETEPSQIVLPQFFQGDYRVAIIIDDLGADLSAAEQLVRFPQHLTLSIIPELKYTQKTAELARVGGKEIMIHLPMEPQAHEGLVIEPKTILASMTPGEVESTFNEMVSSVPFAVGMNNHMGSKTTPNRALMSEVLALTKLRGLYFIDSRTTPATQGYAVARELGVPTNFRSVFLDDKRNVAYTEYELDVLLKRMLKQGSAIAIGHPYPTTIEALRKKLPEFERRGVKIVFASDLVS